MAKDFLNEQHILNLMKVYTSPKGLSKSFPSQAKLSLECSPLIESLEDGSLVNLSYPAAALVQTNQLLLVSR